MRNFLFGISCGLVFAIQFVPLQNPLFFGLTWSAITLSVIALFVRSAK